MMGTFPRYFVRVGGFKGGAAYLRYDSPTDGFVVYKHGKVSAPMVAAKFADALVYADRGDWKELTPAEAEALVKPAQKPADLADATLTERHWACIQLRVPQSGLQWLDELIREARRLDKETAQPAWHGGPR